MKKAYQIVGSPDKATMSELTFLGINQIEWIHKNIVTDNDLEDYLNELDLGTFSVYFDGDSLTTVFRVWEEKKEKMTYAKSMSVLNRTIMSYIEDCAGEGSSEGEEVLTAWNYVQNRFSMLDEALDNAYFFVNYVEQMRANGTECRLIEDRANEEGTGGIMELCKELAIGFTEKYFYHEFDGDFDEKIEEYIEETNRSYKNTL